MTSPSLAGFAQPPRIEPAQPSAREWVERTVARYPHLTPDELDHLLGWFKAASALDVGLVASNEEVHDAYVAFREDHLDRFTWGDAVRAGLFVLFFGGGVAAILALGTS
jgi:hypothetical protein